MPGLLKTSTALLALVLWGCAGNDHETDRAAESEAPTRAVTLWTGKMELFMEYPLFTVNSPGKFIVHLTTLADFQPVRTGRIRLAFRHVSGQTFSVDQDSLLREGIFTPMVELGLPGAYEFSLSYAGDSVQDTFLIDGFEVFASAESYPAESEEGDGYIAYLKEQQWKVEFRTETVGERVVSQSFHAVAEVTPRSNAFAEVSAPVTGLVLVGTSASIPPPGTSVRAGQRLLSLAPPLEGENSWTDQLMAFERARADWDRAERLKSRDAISQREYERIRQEYLVRKSGFDASATSTDSTLLEVLSPIPGTISQVHVSPGQIVNAGDPLVTVIDANRVWLRISVFEKDYYKLGTPHGVYVTIPGLDSGLIFEEADMRLISSGAFLDAHSGTIPMLIEVPNRDRLLKVGQTLPAELFNGESRLLLAVPESSVYDEESQQVVFVHVGGETFEKRAVTTGNHDRGWVAILDGLAVGERVVTRGGYQVKLAATTAAIGHPHAH